MVDVFTMGETMLRLSPRKSLRLEQAQNLDMSFGGAESNVAANLARLGKHTVWYSHLPDNPLGRQCVSLLRGYNVDTTAIHWSKNARMGTYYVEFASEPRGIKVWYDRKNSAASYMTPNDLPVKIIKHSRWLHLTGITPALSVSCAQTVTQAMEIARETKITISFDVNYRALLWDLQTASSTLAAYCEMADIVFIAERDARMLFDVGEGQSALEKLNKQFDSTIIMSRGISGCLAFDGEKYYQADAFPVNIVDRLGAGDAFASGVICRLLESATIDEALSFGTALASLALSIQGDIACVDRADIEQVLNSKSGQLRR